MSGKKLIVAANCRERNDTSEFAPSLPYNATVWLLFSPLPRS